ncbi:helicase RepA family protein [Williamsia sp. R60]
MTADNIVEMTPERRAAYEKTAANHANRYAEKQERNRRAAKRTIDAEERAAEAAGVAERIESLWLERDDLDNLPGPEPLLGTLLFRKSLVVLAGAPGSFKSFVALDWAASVATGKPWQGHASERGTVLYLVGEGDAGFPKRIRAWELAHNKGAKAPIKSFPRPMALHKPEDPETKGMVASIVRRTPDLVVIDTLARYTPGMNENSAEDMGRFIQVASRIKDETGACVLVIHHTTKDGGVERGSSALRGASDGLLMMETPNKSRRTVTLVVDRAKDEASGGPGIKLALERVETPKGSSLVIPRVDPFSIGVTPEPPASMPTAKSSTKIKVLWNLYVHMRETSNGWTEAQIRALVKDSPLNLGKSERQRWSEAWGAITKDNHVIQAAGSRWELDTVLVENELGFNAEAETYYRRYVLEENAS